MPGLSEGSEKFFVGRGEERRSNVASLVATTLPSNHRKTKKWTTLREKASLTARSEVRLCGFLGAASEAKGRMQGLMNGYRLTKISRAGRVLLGWVSDFHGAYGNKGLKDVGLGSMDGLVAGGSLSRDIEMEYLRTDTGSGSSEWGDGDPG